MTFDENEADREPPQLGGFFIGHKRHKSSISRNPYALFVLLCGKKDF